MHVLSIHQTLLNNNGKNLIIAFINLQFTTTNTTDFTEAGANVTDKNSWLYW